MTPASRFIFRDTLPELRAAGIGHRVEPRRPIAWRASTADAWQPWAPGITVPADGVMLDFGAELVGPATLSVQGGGPLRARWGEWEGEARCSEPSTVRWFTAQTDAWDVAEGELRTAARRAGRFVHLAGGPVRLLDAVWHLRLPELPESGTFSCSDPLLERIWAICSRTTRLCMQDFYEDGVKRDGLLWIGDFRLQYLCNLGLAGDHRLPLRSLAMIAASQRDDGALPAAAAHGGGRQHPQVIDCMPGVPAWQEQWILYNYVTDFVGALREYHWHSGDAASTRSLVPAARRALAFLTSRIDPAHDDLGLHFYSFNEAADDAHRPRCALLGHLVQAGIDAAALGRALGDAALQADGTALAQRWRGELEACWDGVRGLFADAPGHVRCSWHSQVAALLAGVQPDDPAAILTRASQRCGPPSQAAYIRFWTLEAQLRHGLVQPALDDIRRQWGLFLDLGLTTCPELLYRDPARIAVDRSPLSQCHGWSAAPNWLLPRWVLGVAALEPGWSRVRVAPQLGDLAWASGVVPTPHGPIRVEARRGQAPRVEAPAACYIEIHS